MNRCRHILIGLLLVAVGVVGTQAQADDAKASTPYDAALAEKFGADDYGMKSYVLVILTTGPADITDQQQRSELFSGHFSNMSRLAEEGKLVLAGPLIDDEPKRGLFILNVNTLEAAEALVKTDPAVEAGIFDYELTKWYGSAALMQVGDIHKTIQKTQIQ